MQMALILSTGVALAEAGPVKRGLQRLASIPSQQSGAAVTMFLVSGIASWLNWGFGLVIGAVLAREIARQVRVDFAWLVAAAYSGWVIWGSGPSGSIPLSQASHGNVLNIVPRNVGLIKGFWVQITGTLL